MIKSLYCVADQKANVYLPPFLAFNDQDAQRQVLTTLQKEQSMLSMYPEDYALAHVGDFDDSLGVIRANDPRAITNLKALYDSFKEKNDDRRTDSSVAGPTLAQ